jgi:hypothetical protein
MRRDSRGRFVDRRAHLYRLTYDVGPAEEVYALTPSAAVRQRVSVVLPHTITDLTVMADFAGRKGYAGIGPRIQASVAQPAQTWSERIAAARKAARR